ncbi:MAG: type II toxin-antitoxin system RelE/ParE family toxin [Alistipes senegalensis]|nr:type II toxin-antitoxin system RelE/ParE family toxin [Oxalobacter formigenes]MCM1281580.1 type II toxin-antitoxin system RelE/ParE family toxin [Alistipes senegalensis]
MRSRLRLIAAARKRTAHWVIRQAIGQYAEREEKREIFRQETLRAWEEFRKQGNTSQQKKSPPGLKPGAAPIKKRLRYAISKIFPAALRDLERLRDFLRPKNPANAKRVAAAIIQSLLAVGNHPHIGRPTENLPEKFGK